MRADRRFIAAIVASYAAAGVAFPWSPDDVRSLGPVALAHGAVLSFLFFGWCKAHAQALGVRPPYAAPFLMGAVAPIGLPYYSVRVLGWGGGAWLCLKGIGLVVGATLVAGIGMLASSLVRA
jgi:hypothetical protein